MRYSPHISCALLALLAAMSLSGCSAVPDNRAAPTPSGTAAATLANARTTKERILAQHRRWQGTRYRLGGLSQGGIDCSELVYTTFREQFGLSLPRTTQEQVNVGRKVSRSRLRPGDLVFFKTGYRSRHVGIYIEGNRFLHASTSRGVTVSSLDNPYWHQHYWQARRL